VLSLRQLLDVFKPKNKKPEDKDNLKEELFIKTAKLKKLLASPEWKEYSSLIEIYIDQCRIQKLKYNFAYAYQVNDEKTFKHVAFLDNDIDFAQRLLGIPQGFIDDVEAMEKQEKESEATE